MKAFIERIFKSKKLKKEKEVKVSQKATEAMVEAIIKETPKVEIPKVEIPKVEIPKVEIPKIEAPKEVFKKPGHYFSDCNCFKCIRWRSQNAK